MVVAETAGGNATNLILGGKREGPGWLFAGGGVREGGEKRARTTRKKMEMAAAEVRDSGGRASWRGAALAP